MPPRSNAVSGRSTPRSNPAISRSPIADEDVHTGVERRLREIVGAVAGKLHTGRSRNDQVATDLRLWTKGALLALMSGVLDLADALTETADANSGIAMPGYTHLQRAQPVLLAHHLLAYVAMLHRDLDRLEDAYRRTDVMPLGAGALAGVTYPIDREATRSDLGFSAISANSLDAVSDRDFVLDVLYACSTIAMHLSRLAEEIILWASAEFRFLELADAFSTGSSIMPQKKNPDVAELARGKTGRVYGNLVAMLTVAKGLPLTYNKDFQEDKEALFDSVDTVLATLDVLPPMIRTAALAIGPHGRSRYRRLFPRHRRRRSPGAARHPVPRGPRGHRQARRLLHRPGEDVRRPQRSRMGRRTSHLCRRTASAHRG